MFAIRSCSTCLGGACSLVEWYGPVPRFVLEQPLQRGPASLELDKAELEEALWDVNVEQVRAIDMGVLLTVHCTLERLTLPCPRALHAASICSPDDEEHVEPGHGA